MLSFLLANKTVASNKIIDYSNSNCNTSYQKTGVPLKRGLRAPWGLLKCGMLYIKINPTSRETHWKTPYHKPSVSGAPQAPWKDCWHVIYKNWSHTNHSLVPAEKIALNSWNCACSSFETPCAWVVSHISIFTPSGTVSGFFGTSDSVLTACQPSIKFEGLLACYISKSITVIGKLIATHLIVRLVCQGPPCTYKGALGRLGGPWNVNLSSL